MKIPLILLIAGVALLLCQGCANPPSASGPPESFDGTKSHFARFGTNRVHYLTAGNGQPVIVFVHGWSCNATFWQEQVPAFADKARLILIDLIGHGQSDKPEAYYSMDFLASSVLAVLSQEHVSRAILVGHSMGVAVICRVHAQAAGKSRWHGGSGRILAHTHVATGSVRKIHCPVSADGLPRACEAIY